MDDGWYRSCIFYASRRSLEDILVRKCLDVSAAMEAATTISMKWKAEKRERRPVFAKERDSSIQRTSNSSFQMI